MSDPFFLRPTPSTHNCWDSKSRHLEVFHYHSKFIYNLEQWKIYFLESPSRADNSLTPLPHLQYKHLNLTNFSKNVSRPLLHRLKLITLIFNLYVLVV